MRDTRRCWAASTRSFARAAPRELDGERFDAIVSTYALHHLTDEEKAELLRALFSLLRPGGCVLVGDVAFASRKELLACREACGQGWDEDEIYFAADEWENLPGLSAQFDRISCCAGVLTFAPGAEERQA